MNRTHTSGSNICLILRQGVGEHGGEFGLPLIVSNACPCHTLLLRRGVDCSDDMALPISEEHNEKHMLLIMNKFHNPKNKYSEHHSQHLHCPENIKFQINRIISHNTHHKIKSEETDWLGDWLRNTG
jgi:hypothetical protein